jgi:hypothetical protein
MQWQAVFILGQRMAVRNNLVLFAWLCGLGLPVILQVLSGLTEDVRSYLDSYYGIPSLYIYFVMCFGFATIFVSYYQANGYRKAGTLDLLRVANFNPLAVLVGAFLQLQRMLIPPLLAFLLGILVYAATVPSARSWFESIGILEVLIFALLQILTQAVLCSIPLASLFRRGELLALLSMMLVMPVNALPLLILRFNAVAVIGAMLLLLLLLLTISWLNLRSMWPARAAPSSAAQ